VYALFGGPAKVPPSLGPARTLTTSLVDAQQGGCVDSRRCGAFDHLKKSYLFIFTFDSILSRGMTKIRSITKLYSIYLFIYLCIYYMNIQNASSSRLYNRLRSVDGLAAIAAERRAAAPPAAAAPQHGAVAAGGARRLPLSIDSDSSPNTK